MWVNNMSKCNCYHTQPKTVYTYNQFTGSPIAHDTEVGVCWGTRECDECSCGGDTRKCDFYPKVREQGSKSKKTQKTTMRAKVNLDTMKSINDFVSICSKLDCKVNLVDGNDYCVSAKSLLGVISTMDWSQVFVESDKDIYTYIQDFIAE